MGPDDLLRSGQTWMGFVHGIVGCADKQSMRRRKEEGQDRRGFAWKDLLGREAGLF